MTARTYENPEDFRQALLARLRATAVARGTAIQDLQLRFLMERLLARIFFKQDQPWLLKGGFALDLRYRPLARTTRDLDLTIGHAGGDTLGTRLESVLDQLREAASAEFGDHLVYRIEDSRGELPGPLHGGTRFPVAAFMGGKLFGRFHLDVGMSDAVIGSPEFVSGDDLLAFAGVSPATAFLVPKEQQFAEKLHAYTFLWTDRENSRVKDLVDMALLVERGMLAADLVGEAVRVTFERRATHPIPASIARPPESWRKEFSPMAREAGLVHQDIDGAFEAVAAFVTSVSAE